MIKPTIGRVVLVTRKNVDGIQTSDQHEPAFVSYVWSDHMINVGGFDRNGLPFSATSVALLQDDDKAPSMGTYAEWMPYQKQAAADAAAKVA